MAECKQVGIIGCGVMGKALAERLVEAQAISAPIFLYDHHQAKAADLAAKLGEGQGVALATPKELLQNAEQLFIAVKPKEFPPCALHIQGHLHAGHTIYSVMTGVTTQALSQLLAPAAVLRLMPNLALRCGSAVIAIAQNTPLYTDLKQRHSIEAFLQPLGELFWMDEQHMEALTALTGSGPAFFLIFLEAMVEAAISLGFDAKTALKLCCQTVKGSVDLLNKEGGTPQELIWQIASPGGTTIAGIVELEKCAMRYGVISAFSAACRRAQQLHVSNTPRENIP